MKQLWVNPYTQFSLICRLLLCLFWPPSPPLNSLFCTQTSISIILLYKPLLHKKRCISPHSVTEKIYSGESVKVKKAHAYIQCNLIVPQSSKLMTWTCSICSKRCLLCFIHGTWYISDTLSKNPWSPPRIVSNIRAVCSCWNQDHSDGSLSFTLPIISVFIIAWQINVTLHLEEHVRLGGLWKRHTVLARI